MSEPDITPLARKLAEQNNVDWRRLQGSGDGGKIVERDVLGFLARVMAGEEAVDPTPEPLPEGMEAWPDQDIASVRQSVGEAATLGELRQEIGSAVREEPDVGEDVFLFDDEPETAARDAEPAEQPSYRGGVTVVSDDLDDLLVSGDEPLPLDDFGTPEPEPTSLGGGQSYVDSFAAEPEPAEVEPSWGDGIEIGGSGRGGAETADVWAESAATEDVDLFEDAPTHVAEASFGTADEEPDLWAAPAPREPVASVSEDLWASDDEGSGSSRFEAWEAEPAEDEPPAFTAEPESVPAAEPDSGFDLEPESPFVAEREPTFAEEGEVVAAAAETGAPGEMAGPAPDVGALPLARLGTVVRRHVDVSALASAQLAVSQELGYEEPLGAAPFLLRAVAKAAAEAGVLSGQVALATFGQGLTLRRVDSAATRPFAEIVKDIAGPGGEEDEPGLVAADLSGLDVDEVVLDLDLPVVSLGRILYDNQRGGYRSTLTLTGDLPADAGARLLSRVADLLDSPVRLVM